MKGFLLGLANGSVCLAYCAPVLIPYFLGNGRNLRRNYLELGQFLAGRLSGYLLFAVAAWLFNLLVLQDNVHRELIFGVSYLALAALMVSAGLSGNRSVCAAEAGKKFLADLAGKNRSLLPMMLGFFTGLNLCPPFLLAFTDAAAGNSLGNSLCFFSAFFLGTSLFFLPVPFLGVFRRREALRTIGRSTAVVIGCYYFLTGILTIIGGISRL